MDSLPRPLRSVESYICHSLLGMAAGCHQYAFKPNKTYTESKVVASLKPLPVNFGESLMRSPSRVATSIDVQIKQFAEAF